MILMQYHVVQHFQPLIRRRYQRHRVQSQVLKTKRDYSKDVMKVTLVVLEAVNCEEQKTLSKKNAAVQCHAYLMGKQVFNVF